LTTEIAHHDRREAVGGVLVGLASILFGSVVIFGKYALREGMSVPSMLAVRFGIGAVLLAIALILTGRPLLAAPGERWGLGILAVCGYAVEASFFFAAASRGTAASVTLLFFTYPVFVALGAWLVGRGSPTRLTLLALGSAVGGAAIVVGTGGSLSIQPLGVVFALAAAVTYTGYLIGADVVLKRSDPMTSAMWVSAGASLGLFVFAFGTGQWTTPSGWGAWGPILGMGVASAGAFVCLLAGLQRLGAVRTSIVAAMEPLAAAVLGTVFLDEAVTSGTVLGGALILVGAVMASLARPATPQEQQIP
jgi:drug/metabolite transporter (DMT)-like permease